MLIYRYREQHNPIKERKIIMYYYRVKPEYDQKQRIKNHKYSIKRKPDGIFVANELYTAGELDKFYLTEKQYGWFECVTIPKNKVYWSFGCRFEMKER
jgi:hypothetical protein